jgi:hypothetical protein
LPVAVLKLPQAVALAPPAVALLAVPVPASWQAVEAAGAGAAPSASDSVTMASPRTSAAIVR